MTLHQFSVFLSSAQRLSTISCCEIACSKAREFCSQGLLLCCSLFGCKGKKGKRVMWLCFFNLQHLHFFAQYRISHGSGTRYGITTTGNISWATHQHNVQGGMVLRAPRHVLPQTMHSNYSHSCLHPPSHPLTLAITRIS